MPHLPLCLITTVGCSYYSITESPQTQLGHIGLLPAGTFGGPTIFFHFVLFMSFLFWAGIIFAEIPFSGTLGPSVGFPGGHCIGFFPETLSHSWPPAEPADPWRLNSVTLGLSEVLAQGCATALVATLDSPWYWFLLFPACPVLVVSSQGIALRWWPADGCQCCCSCRGPSCYTLGGLHFSITLDSGVTLWVSLASEM